MKIAKKIAGGIFRERDPTQGPILKESISMTSFLWSETLFWILIHTLNLFWLSKISLEAIPAVEIGSIALMILMTPILGITTATYGMIGGYNKQDQIGLKKQVKQILSITWISSLCLAFLGYFLAPLLLQFLRAQPKIINLAVIYLRIQAIAGIIFLSFWPIREVIRNLGRIGQATILTFLFLIVKGVFDYLLILGKLGFPRLGVVGASLSFAIAGVISTIVGFCWLNKKKVLGLDLKKWQDFKINFQTLKEITRIAGFDTVHQLTRHGVPMVMIAIVASYGTLALNAYSIGRRFFRYTQVFALDIGRITAIGCANNLEVKKIERAKKWAWSSVGVATVLVGGVSLFLFIFAPQILAIFRGESQVIKIGTDYFRIVAPGFIFFAIALVLEKAFAAAKDTRTIFWVYLVASGLQIGLAFYFSQIFGIIGVWFAISIAAIFNALILVLLFRVGYWLSKMTLPP